MPGAASGTAERAFGAAGFASPAGVGPFRRAGSALGPAEKGQRSAGLGFRTNSEASPAMPEAPRAMPEGLPAMPEGLPDMSMARRSAPDVRGRCETPREGHPA